MTFGRKLKKLRQDNQMTQEELAERLYVTRTAVSKWETDKGYPAIDTLKTVSELFGVPVDDLISDDDVTNTRLLDEKRAKKFYVCAVVALGVTMLFALLTWLLKIEYLLIGALVGSLSYVVFGILAKPAYKRREERNNLAAFIISKIVLAAIFIAVSVGAVLQMTA